MAHGWTRRQFAIGATAAALAASSLSSRPRAAEADAKTLRFIPQSDLRVLDPVFTTAYVTRNHGYMIFDTLFAIDDKFKPHPQMVGEWNVSPDKLIYSFVLRDGLKFHGQPVRGIDCTTSLKRWMARDTLGQTLAAAVAEMQGGTDKKFSIRLKTPFPLLINALAKVSSLAPFIMPERLAKTDPFKQITEMVGSGPFKFVAAEYQPGNRIVYAKNTEYVPRHEPPVWASGGKVVKLDRVEWHVIPDDTTKLATIGSGEADWWENPSPDMWPVLAGNADVTLAIADRLKTSGCIRFNWRYPPFDNVKMRQAVQMVVNQADYMAAFAGDPKNWNVCPSVFTCGTPMASAAGASALTGKRDYEKARELIKETGYKGEKIILLDAVDQPLIHAEALVLTDELKKLGLNVEYVASDWGTVVTRRASKKPPTEGGWNIFETGWVGADTLDPAGNVLLRANGDGAWFGWPQDDGLEALRTQWLQATDLEERQEIAARLQQRAFEVVPYIPTGQFVNKTAYRKNIKGIVESPALFLMWNVEKA
jgi:peptide/nickel transport system substrate-binding protein